MDVSSKTSYGSSGAVTLLGALTLNQWTAVIGIILAIGTFLVNWYYRKKMRDDTKEHYRKSEQIQRDKDEDQEEQRSED